MYDFGEKWMVHRPRECVFNCGQVWTRIIVVTPTRGVRNILVLCVVSGWCRTRWAYSSNGRVTLLQGDGCRFESCWVHELFLLTGWGSVGWRCWLAVLVGRGWGVWLSGLGSRLQPCVPRFESEIAFTLFFRKVELVVRSGQVW